VGQRQTRPSNSSPWQSLIVTFPPLVVAPTPSCVPCRQVLCRFCAPDILHPHRALMGAPPGVPVYALDGSLILRADQDVGSCTL
jgi:hypothetical protein